MSLTEVFHLTLEDRLASLDEGLIPRGGKALTGGQKRWAEKTESVRPQWIKDLEIHRAGAVYAHPEFETAKNIVERNTSPGSIGQSMIVLSLDVDPDSVVVCDSWCLGEGYSGEDYWQTAVTLSSFKQYFGVTHSTHGLRCEVNDAGKGRFSIAAYLQPEVLLPGVVEPHRLGIAMRSEHPIRPNIHW